jgi:hypothetical protein
MKSQHSQKMWSRNQTHSWRVRCTPFKYRSTHLASPGSTQYVFEIPESEPPSNITGFGSTGSGPSSGVSDSFLPSQTMTPIQTLGLAQGLKLFSGAMLIFCLASVALKQYGMALGT